MIIKMYADLSYDILLSIDTQRVYEAVSDEDTGESRSTLSTSVSFTPDG